MKDQILLVGLGNPGEKYKNTRHNIGFDILNKIGSGDFKYEARFDAEIFRLSKNIFLMKPQTYMNLSGKAVAGFAKFYKIHPKNIWIVHDDIDLPLGTIRTRLRGSSGGHKGIQSIIESLGTDNFYRFRIGIHSDRATEQGTEKFVLAKFTLEEKRVIAISSSECIGALEESFKIGVPTIETIKKN